MANSKEPPKKNGRPSLFTQELANEICNRLSQGEPLAKICRDEHMPSVNTVSNWKAGNAELSGSIACAREEGFDVIAADTLDIVDTKPERTLTAEGDKVDSGHVAWLKNRAEQRLKLLAKWDPKRYGERLAIGGADDMPPIKTISDTDLDLKIAALQAELQSQNG